MTVTYSHAPDAQKIGEKLIAAHHTHLTDIRVEYVFRSKHSKSNGKAVAGKARKITGLNAFLATITTSPIEDAAGDDFFVIELAADIWLTLSAAQRTALVDHELCHCTIEFDEERNAIVLGLRGHDVEEFAAIVQRHGLWSDDLREFAEATKEQLSLLDDAAA